MTDARETSLDVATGRAAWTAAPAAFLSVDVCEVIGHTERRAPR